MFKRFAISSVELLERPAGNPSQIEFRNASGKTFVRDSGESATFEYDPENFVYFRCRAISADIPNGNGDLFPEDELRKAYKSFVGVGLYLDHDSGSVDKSIGKVLWAEWIPEGKYVECYCCVDKKLSPDMARRVEMGETSTVSMGCMVGEAICGVDGCGNIAHNSFELCEHMIPGRGIKGKKGSDGKVTYEINKQLQFTELSLVTVPADPTAKIFEVFASMKSGKITEEEFRRIINDEIATLVGELTAKILVSNAERKAKTAVSAPTTVTTGSTANVLTTNDMSTATSATTAETGKTTTPAEKTVTEVEKLVNSTEEKMKLTISYLRGRDLASSFFIAKEASAEYRVAATDVLPLVVQEAIQERQPGIATPDQVCEDLQAKCQNMSDFKKWAKKRKKKNRKAVEKMTEKGDECPAEEKKADVSAPAVIEAPAPEATPAVAQTEVLNPAPESVAPATDTGTPEPTHTESPTGDNPLSIEDLQLAIQELQKRLEEKMKATTSLKQAVKTQENVVENRDNGASEGKPSPAPAPKAIQEVSKTENPKGHIDKGAALEKTAAEDLVFSVNPKELEKAPKPAKPVQAAPPNVAWDTKEMQSEQVKVEKGGNAGSAVKKFYNRLPSGGLGEVPKAMDLKSGKDPEKEMLRQALEKAEAEKQHLLEKERLQSVADKIYEIVKALREKNILTAEKEDEVISLLGTNFKEMAMLDGVLGLVSAFSAQAPAAPAHEAGEPEVGNVVPQVFEPISETEDAINTMAKIWNL